MKYLVTGGAGFIGSHIVEALLHNGHEVCVLDNLSTGSCSNLAHIAAEIEFIEGDIRDAETCLLAARNCDGVFHQAALVSVFDSIERPRDNHSINNTGTMNVLEAARENGCKRVVYASSAAIYGNNPQLPKNEMMLPEPLSPYGSVKIGGEYYLQAYAEQFKMNCIALRYFNVYGPRQNPNSVYSGVISKFVDCAKKCLQPTIFGDGQQTRDFVYIEDVVQANLKAMTVPTQLPFFNCNVATGKATSLLDLVEALGAITGTLGSPVFKTERAGDIRHSLADISKARKFLGFEPLKTDLRANLESILDADLILA